MSFALSVQRRSDYSMTLDREESFGIAAIYVIVGVIWKFDFGRVVACATDKSGSHNDDIWCPQLSKLVRLLTSM
jgi:hypothetical protein